MPPPAFDNARGDVAYFPGLIFLCGDGDEKQFEDARTGGWGVVACGANGDTGDENTLSMAVGLTDERVGATVLRGGNA